METEVKYNQNTDLENVQYNGTDRVECWNMHVITVSALV